VIAAIEQVFPAALRQRCLIHRLRDLAKTPAGMQAESRDGYWAIFDTGGLTTQPGPQLVELIDHRIGEFIDRYRATYPAAMKILDTDRAGLSAYLRFPAEHHQRIRHSNFIERAFGETRRRAKVIGRFPCETSCISIAWAVLDRASRGWRGLSMTPPGSGSCKTCADPCSNDPPASATYRRQAARGRSRECQHRRLTSPQATRLWRFRSRSQQRKGTGCGHVRFDPRRWRCRLVLASRGGRTACTRS